MLAPTLASRSQLGIKVVSLTSTRTQLPFNYYHAPYCRPSKTKHQSENLGEKLAGDDIQTSPYSVVIKKDVKCAILCREELDDSKMGIFRSLIDGEYRVHMMLDNLPAAMHNEEQQYTVRGWPVGFYVDPEDGGERQYVLYNHIEFLVQYHVDPEHFQGYRIVGFSGVPSSVRHAYTLSMGSKKFEDGVDLRTCGKEGDSPIRDISQMMTVNNPGEVIFSYGIRWQESSVTWSHRWDVYMMSNPEDQIHYFSIVNSLMITLFLTGVVAMIMLRTLHRDITAYNELQTIEEAQEESGWKLVHGDVFRPPSFSPMLLSILAGTGVQLLAMTLCTIFFAFLGFLSPANRGAMLTAVLVLFVLTGSFAGYWSSRMFKFFHGKDWKRNTLLTAVSFPGTIFSIFFVVNVTVWSQGSSTAIPIGTFISLLLLWFGVSAPLVFLGSYWGLKAETLTIPVRVNQIARHIPDQQWYTAPAFSIALGGILPFGAVCIELFFIMSALWLHQIYYVFGFLTVVFFILVATCSEITIVMCYFQLCNEDWRWWWRSFLSAGSSGAYLFLYSIWYYSSRLDLEGPVSTLIYFAYMLMISLSFSLLTGSIGFFSCFWFCRRIYSAIKVD
jgi:transmembrane 9 superfamily protein 2/4